jgi:hypothetical protein
MKIKILLYKCFQGNNVRVQSHNLRKGVWKKNPRFEFHQAVANQNPKYTFGGHPILYKKECEVIVKDG